MPTTRTTRIDNPASAFKSDIDNVTFLAGFFDRFFFRLNFRFVIHDMKEPYRRLP